MDHVRHDALVKYDIRVECQQRRNVANERLG